MTKQAVRHGFSEFIEDVIDHAEENISPSRALAGEELDIDTLMKNLSEESDREVNKIRNLMKAQLNAIIGFIEGEKTKDEFYKTNPIYRYVPDDHHARDHIRESLKEHLDKIVEDLKPVYYSEFDNFYKAIEKEYDKEEAVSIIEMHFNRINEMERYLKHIEKSIKVGPSIFSVKIDLSEEIARVMLESEQYAKNEALNRIEKTYDGVS